MNVLSIVVPCFNEQEVLTRTSEVLAMQVNSLIKKGKISSDSTVCFVDDGSTDNTWSVIRGLSEDNSLFSGIKLTSNRGHQYALLAGLLSVRGDIIISIDADLQDDVSIIECMIRNFEAGDQIVYGVRDSRSNDSAFKRWTAQLFYKILAFLGVDIVYNHADFRLMSRSAIEALREFNEYNVFLRGIVPQLGFKSSRVFYERLARAGGETKYPLRKMLSLAWEGVTSLSVAPLRMVSGLGGVVFVFSVLISLFVVFVKLFTNQAVPGWASTVLPIYLLGGIQILCIGIIGEYAGKIYKEVKARPRYLIEETCGSFDAINEAPPGS